LSFIFCLGKKKTGRKNKGEDDIDSFFHGYLLFSGKSIKGGDQFKTISCKLNFIYCFLL